VTGPSSQEPQPHLRVVRGQPDHDELVALVAGLSGAAEDEEHEAAGPTRWAARARTRRRPGRPGPDAWRWSGR